MVTEHTPKNQPIFIHRQAIARYRSYKSEYEQSNATHQALLEKFERSGLTPFELQMLHRAEDDCIFNQGWMRRLQAKYPAVDFEKEG